MMMHEHAHFELQRSINASRAADTTASDDSRRRGQSPNQIADLAYSSSITG